MSKSKPKPCCPFCGAASNGSATSETDRYDRHFQYVECKNCRARGPRCYTWSDAEAGWKRRSKGKDTNE